MLVLTLAVWASISALLAIWLPLQVSVVTVFLFAGPHNWFELRYFLMRLPVRFGRSRAFFLTAFAGIAFLTLTYVSLPLIYNFKLWPGADWSIPIAIWNTFMLMWLGVLVWLRFTVCRWTWADRSVVISNPSSPTGHRELPRWWARAWFLKTSSILRRVRRLSFGRTLPTFEIEC